MNRTNRWPLAKKICAKMILIPTCWAGEGTTILSTKGGILGTAGLESNTGLDTTGYPVYFLKSEIPFIAHTLDY